MPTSGNSATCVITCSSSTEIDGEEPKQSQALHSWRFAQRKRRRPWRRCQVLQPSCEPAVCERYRAILLDICPEKFLLTVKVLNWSTLLVTFYCGIISAKVLLENLYCRFFKKFWRRSFTGESYFIAESLNGLNFPAEALVENIYCRSFSGELLLAQVLLEKSYRRRSAAEILLYKFYWRNFYG